MNSIQIALAKIVTKNFETTPDIFKPKTSINLNFGLTYNFEKEQRLVGCTFKVNFTQKETIFLVLEVAAIFQIEENSWNELLKENGKKIILPKPFAEHLGVLAIGTSRGVLHCKTENTEFNQFVLPTIDVKKIIEKDIEFTFKSNKKYQTKKK